jgi:hypothetical protein
LSSCSNRGALRYEAGQELFAVDDSDSINGNLDELSRFVSLLDMKFFIPLLLILLILPISARPLNSQFNSGKKFSGADRTITWRQW